ncbi:hypothetical protein AKJ16_DCAP24891 [Drosera capensis]
MITNNNPKPACDCVAFALGYQLAQICDFGSHQQLRIMLKNRRSSRFHENGGETSKGRMSEVLRARCTCIVS